MFRKHCIQPLIAFVPIRIRKSYSWIMVLFFHIVDARVSLIPIWNQGRFTWKRRFRLRIELHGNVINCTQHVSRINIHCFASGKPVLSLVHLKASRDYRLPSAHVCWHGLCCCLRWFHLCPTVVSGTAFPVSEPTELTSVNSEHYAEAPRFSAGVSHLLVRLQSYGLRIVSQK